MDAAGGLWPEASTLSQTRAVNVGLNGAPFEIQNSILIRKPGNTHVKCRKLSQCRTTAHLAQSQAGYAGVRC